MKRNYRVKVENLDVNPEFGVDKEEQEGIECEGYMLVTFKENNEETMSMSTSAHHVTIKQIADWLETSDNQMKYMILQAALIAYGNIQARRLYEERQKKNMMRDIFGMIGKCTPMEDDD